MGWGLDPPTSIPSHMGRGGSQVHLTGFNAQCRVQVHHGHTPSLVAVKRPEGSARVDGLDSALGHVYMAVPVAQGQIVARGLSHLPGKDGGRSPLLVVIKVKVAVSQSYQPVAEVAEPEAAFEIDEGGEG